MKETIDFITKLINGSLQLADGVVIKNSQKAINLTIVPIENGFKIDFLFPEPVISINKFISISDSIDYIKVTSGKISIKLRTWPVEIPIELK